MTTESLVFGAFVCGLLCGSAIITGYNWAAMVLIELPLGDSIVQIFPQKWRSQSPSQNDLTKVGDPLKVTKVVTEYESITGPRLLCWVPTVGLEKHKIGAQAVKDTWGKRCDKLLFISSIEDKELGSIVIPNVLEGRKWLWAKTRGALHHIWTNHRDDADWFLKADDDTYVLVDNLKQHLSHHNTTHSLYIGHIAAGDKVEKERYMYGGAGYILSRRTLERFITEAMPNETICEPADPNLRPGHRGDEDVELGRCLRNIGGVSGIVPVDEKYQWRMVQFRKNNFGFQLPETRNDSQCCKDTILSIHRVSPLHQRLFEYLLYHVKVVGGLSDLEGGRFLNYTL